MSSTRTLSFHARLSKGRLMLIWLSWQLAIAGALHVGYMVRFKKIGTDSHHVSHTLFELEGHDKPQCAMACINTETCVSFSVTVSPDVPGSSCRLSRSSAGVTDLQPGSGWSYFVMVDEDQIGLNKSHKLEEFIVITEEGEGENEDQDEQGEENNQNN
ncbi:uncharacterized protein LOC106152121 [Lingula anatina]|uniref:Uncharacterized protein LOC106152121 n=1 Tax=Lingula anatina TaxID=7574 RepID=A0A1S3H7H4_LINAN|nr:uncharacterized protein LOC106152121 [Lingula anatina]|eukprot:XP_013381069.1 uncharacterized protein LOC106152121 [Lingula anatina]